MRISGEAQAAVVQVAALGVAALVVWWLVRRGLDSVADSPDRVATAVGGVLSGMAAQPVFAVSDVLGIPRTDVDRCQAAKIAGSSWDASFYCPAGEFLSWMFSGSNSNAGRGASGTW